MVEFGETPINQPQLVLVSSRIGGKRYNRLSPCASRGRS
jgi:hypothetical protein